MFCRKMQCFYSVPILQFLVFFHVGYSTKILTAQITAELPPSVFPKDNTTYNIIRRNDSLLLQNANLKAPMVFPEKGSNYTIIENSTILQKLVGHVDNKDTEVPDLLQIDLTKTKNIHSDKEKEMVTESKERDGTTSVTEDDPQMDAEYITTEPKWNDTKGVAHSVRHLNHEHLNRGGGPMVQGQLAAIFAGVFAMIAVVSYIGLLSWRRFLEHRYGNREILVNEDEYINYSDIKNFEL